MTVVELFDGVSICNMASCLVMRPERVIFVGESEPMERLKFAYKKVAENHGIEVDIGYEPINKNSIANIIEVLSKIVETEESCVFDLTGGEDLVLVAMGIVYEKYKNVKNVQMHKFNIASGKVYDCDSDGILPDAQPPELTVRDNIMLYGGSVVPYDGNKGTPDWFFDDEFVSDVKTMWEICRDNPGLWNVQIGTFKFMSENSAEGITALEFAADKNRTEEQMKKRKLKYVWNKWIVKRLCSAGFLIKMSDDDVAVHYMFKNEQVKRCLTKAGTVLELTVLLHAFDAKEKDGSKRFSDAVSDVFIDWDAELHEIDDEIKDTENEVDIILMKGLIPIFISCKNGYVDENELYKLNTVAAKFGGPNAKKALVTTYFGNEEDPGYKHFVQRTIDMKIQLIAGVHEFSEEKFAKRIKNINCN